MNNHIPLDLHQQAFSENVYELNDPSSGEEVDQDLCSTEQRAEELENEFYASTLPDGFFFEGDRLMYAKENSEGESQPSIFVASRLHVVAITRDEDGNHHGRLLEFKDPDGKKKQWAMPMSLLARDGAEYRAELLSLGLQIGSQRAARSLLTNYILSCEPSQRALCVMATGWHNQCFVLPDQVIGISQEKVILQRGTNTMNPYSASRSLDEWNEYISTFCRGNSRLLLAVSSAFAPPFLKLIGSEGGGIHFFGPSSVGKSTASKVACSVWGGERNLQRWRMTVNGLEAVAALYNDTLLCLDEISQCDPSQVGETAYLLANGAGKGRADRTGGMRNRTQWDLIFLSNGEERLEQMIERAGQKKRGGQEVRMIEIPAETGAYGIFEDLHGFIDGKSFSEALDQNARIYFGAVGRVFLEKLVIDRERWKESAKEIASAFMKKHSLPGSDGQVGRVLNRFALIAAAGEIATKMGLTGWEEKEASSACSKCFQDWLDYRGGIDSQEEKAIISHLCHFFEKYGESRFTPWDSWPEEKTPYRAGFRKEVLGEVEFFVFTNVFRKEICKGFDPVEVAKVAIKHGFLRPEKNGNPTRSESLPGRLEQSRCYRITSRVLGGWEHVTSDDEKAETNENHYEEE